MERLAEVVALIKTLLLSIRSLIALLSHRPPYADIPRTFTQATAVRRPPASEGVLPLPNTWQRQIERRAPTAPRHRAQAMEAAAFERIHARVEACLEESKAPSTWGVIASVANQFQAFDRAQRLPAYRALPLDERMAMWLHHKIDNQEIHRQSPVTYAKILSGIFRKITGEGSEILKELTAGLRRTTAPSQGALPLSVEALRRLLAKSQWPPLRCQILMQWVTASRSDDMNRIRAKDLKFDTVGAHYRVTTTWWVGTKGSHLPYTDISYLPYLEWLRLRRYVNQFPADQKVFRLDPEAMTAAMRNLLQTNDPRLSSHSLKKGALVHLINQGFTLGEVAYKAKHQSTELLRVYVGPVAWAEAHNATGMAIALSAL